MFDKVYPGNPTEISWKDCSFVRPHKGSTRSSTDPNSRKSINDSSTGSAPRNGRRSNRTVDVIAPSYSPTAYLAPREPSARGSIRSLRNGQHSNYVPGSPSCRQTPPQGRQPPTTGYPGPAQQSLLHPNKRDRIVAWSDNVARQNEQTGSMRGTIPYATAALGLQHINEGLPVMKIPAAGSHTGNSRTGTQNAGSHRAGNHTR